MQSTSSLKDGHTGNNLEDREGLNRLSENCARRLVVGQLEKTWSANFAAQRLLR
jgi:hypothetical protein